MAVSFSAEYLYQGAKLLSRPQASIHSAEEDGFQCPEAVYTLARGVYSLGVTVIAPIGMLYHAVAAGVYYTRSLVGREVVPLGLLATQHLDAAGCDAKAFGTILTSIAFIALVVILIKFDRSFESITYTISAFIIAFGQPIYEMTQHPYAESIFLTYNYMMSPPLGFCPLLSDEQGDIYLVNLQYRHLVRSGMAIDRPLDDEARQAIINFNAERFANPVAGGIAITIDGGIAINRLLHRLNRVPEANRVRTQAFLDRAHLLEAAWRRIETEATNLPEEGREDFIKREFGAELQTFQNSLPPIGAAEPAPASA